MKPRLFLLLLLPTFLGSLQGALDLTPAVKDVVEDGNTYREVSFNAPEGKLQLTLPSGWNIRGQGNRAQITAADKPAEGIIESIPLQKPEPLDDAAIMKFKQQVVAGLPAGSTKVTTVYEAANSVLPGGNPSFEIVVSYDLWGKVFKRSALLVNGPQGRLLFRFTAPQKEFDLANTQFRRMIMTWRAVQPQQAPKAVVADAGTRPSATN